MGQIVTTPEPQQVSSPDKYRNLKLMIIGLILLTVGVAIGLVTGKFIYTRKTPVIPISPSTSVNSIVNWKEYKSDKNNFSFRYPNDLYTIDSDDILLTFYTSLQHANEAKVCIDKKLGTPEQPCNRFMVLSLSATKRSHKINFLTYRSYIDAQGRKWSVADPVEGEGKYNLEALQEESEEPMRISIQANVKGFELYRAKTLVIQYENGTYDDSEFLREYEDLVNSIVSTFKFIDGTF